LQVVAQVETPRGGATQGERVGEEGRVAQVQAGVRAGVVVVLAMSLMMVGGAAAVFVALSPGVEMSASGTARQEDGARVYVELPSATASPFTVTTEEGGVVVEVKEVVAVEAVEVTPAIEPPVALTAGGGEGTATADAVGEAKAAKRKSKPKPYEIARIIQPAFKGCAPRDLMAPGHPVWYTPTVTTMVRDGGFEGVRVSVALSDTDPAKIKHAKGGGAVTQADLDGRRRKVEQCVAQAVTKTKIPASNAQAKTEGKVRMSFSHDGVPFGVKNL
jgi:hypothetical protein